MNRILEWLTLGRIVGGAMLAFVGAAGTYAYQHGQEDMQVQSQFRAIDVQLGTIESYGTRAFRDSNFAAFVARYEEREIAHNEERTRQAAQLNQIETKLNEILSRLPR